MSKEDHLKLIALTNAYKSELAQIMNKRNLSPEAIENIAEFIRLEILKVNEERA